MKPYTLEDFNRLNKLQGLIRNEIIRTFLIKEMVIRITKIHYDNEIIMVKYQEVLSRKRKFKKFKTQDVLDGVNGGLKWI